MQFALLCLFQVFVCLTGHILKSGDQFCGCLISKEVGSNLEICGLWLVHINNLEVSFVDFSSELEFTCAGVALAKVCYVLEELLVLICLGDIH